MHANDILWIFNKNSRKFFLRSPPHPSTWLLINCSLECSLSLAGWEHTKSFATSYREGSDKRFEHHVWKALLSPSNRAQNVCAPKEDVNNADLIYTFAAVTLLCLCVTSHCVCCRIGNQLWSVKEKESLCNQLLHKENDVFITQTPGKKLLVMLWSRICLLAG